jgi:hypothetical protein
MSAQKQPQIRTCQHCFRLLRPELESAEQSVSEGYQRTLHRQEANNARNQPLFQNHTKKIRPAARHGAAGAGERGGLE